SVRLWARRGARDEPDTRPGRGGAAAACGRGPATRALAALADRVGIVPRGGGGADTHSRPGVSGPLVRARTGAARGGAASPGRLTPSRGLAGFALGLPAGKQAPP